MASAKRANRPADLVDWRVTHNCVYDLPMAWRTPRPDVPGLRAPQEIDALRGFLMAGHPLRTDTLAPRLVTDRGQEIARRVPFAEGSAAVAKKVVSNGAGIAAAIAVPVFLLAMLAALGSPVVWVALLLFVAYPATVKITVDAIAAETLTPTSIVVPLRPSELTIVRDVRGAVDTITSSRAYREGYLDQHRALVDLGGTADAITRRVVDISGVRGQVNRLSGPVRGHAEEAMRTVDASLATQVQALQSYSRHVRQLDRHLRDADSNLAAGPVFDAIRGLLAATVQDEQQLPRLSDAVEVTQATSYAITATVQEAAADLYRLLGTQTPSLPQLR